MEIRLAGAVPLVAVIDDADVELVAGFTWFKLQQDHRIYATRAQRFGPPQTMHGLITGWPYVDHIDCNGLNNRRSNLRQATALQNSRNRRPNRTGSSPYKGVHLNGCYSDGRARWRAVITVEGKRIALGTFTDEVEAAKTYDRAAVELFGEFARHNGLGV